METKAIPATLVFYETPHRLAKSLIDCLEILGNRNAAVVREITKLHEETIGGDLWDFDYETTYNTSSRFGDICTS